MPSTCVRLVYLGLCLVPLAAHAVPPLRFPGAQGLGLGHAEPLLVSPKRFEMHQSYSLSFASSGKASMSQGLYLNQMSYQLADPLTLHLDLGMLTPLQSSGMASTAVAQHGSIFVPRVGLEYKPTDNLLMSVYYSQMPAGTALESPLPFGR